MPLRRLRALALAAVLLAACSGGGTDAVDAAGDASSTTAGAAPSSTDTADAGSRESTTTIAPPGGETTTSTAAPSGDTGTTSAAPTSSEPAPPTSAAAATTLPEPVVPRPGTYTYDQTRTTDEGTETEQATSVVERLSGDDRSGRVRLTERSSDGDQTSEAEVAPSSTVVDLTVLDSPLGSIDCDWDPNWTLTAAHRTGNEWSFASSCDDEVSGADVHVELSGTGRIVGTETVEVRGRSVDTWVEQRSILVTVDVTLRTGSFRQEIRSESTSHVDPGLGMVVRSESTETMSGDAGNESSRTRRVLVAW